MYFKFFQKKYYIAIITDGGFNSFYVYKKFMFNDFNIFDKPYKFKRGGVTFYEVATPLQAQSKKFNSWLITESGPNNPYLDEIIDILENNE